MSTELGTSLDDLRAAVSGQVLVSGDSGYDEARTIWNGGIDRRPAVIVRCQSAADVGAGIGYARSHDLEISVRGGAHNIAGNSVAEGGLMLDLSELRQVRVDTDARRCWVGGGATLADRDGATQAHGLATPSGLVGHTGVGGLTLVGGMGWLTRMHGLSVDNLVGAEVVTADGRILHASADEHPDLFWAIRGGGGNFGVVTEFEFQLHPVGPIVHFGLFFWPLERGADVLRLARRLADQPRTVNAMVVCLNAPPEPFVPEEVRFQPGYAIAITGFGGEEQHAAAVDLIRSELPPTFDLVTPMPYAQLLQLFDEANAFGVHAYDKAVYIEDFTDGVIATMTDYIPRKTSPRTAVFVYRLDGAYSEVAELDTAFGGGRSPRYAFFLIALADDAATLAVDRAWVREFWDALQPHALGSGSYLNGETEPTQDRVRDSYGPVKYERLTQIKATYDPDNVFHLNANIPPAGSET